MEHSSALLARRPSPEDWSWYKSEDGTYKPEWLTIAAVSKACLRAASSNAEGRVLKSL